MLCAVSAVLRVTILLWCFRVLKAQSGPTNWTASPFNPPALPLVVRNPYMNAWLGQGDNPPSLNAAWPSHWNMVGNLGWSSSVVVDGTSYKLMGEANDPPILLANQTAVELTPTRTSFIFTAGTMQINMSFISPIEPADLVRQSLPFSYVTMSASSLDGNAHVLPQQAVPSSLNSELISGDNSRLAQWHSEDDDSHTILTMQLQAPQAYTEIANQAQDATEYLCVKKVNGANASWAITDNVAIHALAANTSVTLGDQADANFRAVNDQWPNLGIAVDWASITQTSEPAVWAVGLVRSPSINYRTADGSMQDRYSYFLSTYSDGLTAAFLDDFSYSQSTAQAFDAQVADVGKQYSTEYSDMLALSTRQVMGSIDITISKTDGGDWNLSDVKVFMKNMGGLGSDVTGSGLSVNTVDTLYAAFPAFLYLNPEFLGYLLAPLLEYQDSSAYLLGYAARNIGSSYPNATADSINDSHNYGVEESANMLIMTLAYSQRSGNGTFISRHYILLREWAEYLETNSFTSTNQRSADFALDANVPTNNQTNLALKGIIGIACMAKIAEIAGVHDDSDKFNNTATSLIMEWQSNAISADNSHIDFIYGDSDSSGLIYNLYADKLLQLNLISDSIYDATTSFYSNVAEQWTYGMPLNNGDPEVTTAHWMMYGASTVTDTVTRDYMISQLRAYAASSRNSKPFTSVYDPSTGSALSGDNAGQNSPASGAFFSLLALNTTIKSTIDLPADGSTIPGSSPLTTTNKSKVNVGAIAGGTVGGLIALAIIFGIFCYFRRRRRLRMEYESSVMSRPIPVAELGGHSTTHSSSRGVSKQLLLLSYENDSEKILRESKARNSSNDQHSSRDESELHGVAVRPASEVSDRDPVRTRSMLNARLAPVIERLRASANTQQQFSGELAGLRREMELLRQTSWAGPGDAPPSYSGFTT